MSKFIISQGAEAVIYKGKACVVGNREDAIIKDRVKKNYRIEAIDSRLRKFRTRREAKILEKLNAWGFCSPKLIDVDDKNMLIRMSFIKGQKVRDILCRNNYKRLCGEIGQRLAFLHKHDIIHADLTTSNIILEEKAGKVFIIDFGLSFFSSKTEDKAVDIHLLRQALESKHSEIWESCFSCIIKFYKKKYDAAENVLNRLESVEKRGRYKGRAVKIHH